MARRAVVGQQPLDTSMGSGLSSLTGEQGFGTPAAQENATIQGLGGAATQAGPQSPAEKLLQYATNFPAPLQPTLPQAPQSPSAGETIAGQLFPSSGEPFSAPNPVFNLPVEGSMPAPTPMPSAPASPKAGMYEQGQQNEWTQKQSGLPAAPGVAGGLGTGTPGEMIANQLFPAASPPPAAIGAPDGSGTSAAEQFKQQQEQELAKKKAGVMTGAGSVGASTDAPSKLQPSLPSGEAWVNPVPKPSDPNDLEGMAAYYRGFAKDPLKGDPSYAGITAADVGNQRMLALSGKFKEMGHPEWDDIGTWVRAGKPGGQWTPDAGGGGGDAPTTENGGGGNTGAGAQPSTNGMPPGTTLDDLKSWYAADPAKNKPAFEEWLKLYHIDPKAFGINPAPTPAPSPTPAPTPAPTQQVLPPGGPAGGGGGGGATTTTLDEFNAPLGSRPTDLPPIGAPDVSNDPWTQKLMEAMNAYKDSADNQIRRAVTSSAAATGRLNMGGFGGSVAKEIGNYNAGIDKEAAGALSTAHQAALDRAMQGQLAERAQRTQLELGRMDVLTKKYTSDQALEGEKYRAQIDQAIAESQGKVQKEISAAVNEKDISIARLNADTAAKVAAQNAAAASAGAGASVAAQHYAADMAYKETLAKIAQQREEAQLQYNLGLTQVGANVYGKQLDNQQATLQFLQGLGPEQLAKYLFGNQQVPSPVYVQP